MKSYYDVVVIGAGTSGLAAAQYLKQNTQYSVLVLEAQSKAGGRIQQLDGFAPWPIELGGEFIHGEPSIVTDIYRQSGEQLIKKKWPDRVFFGDTQQVVDGEDLQDLDVIYDLLSNVKYEQYPKQDITLQDWMLQKGANQQQIKLASVSFANDFGCSIRQQGLRESIHECRFWVTGEDYFILEKSFEHLITQLQRDTNIQFNFPIRKIDYSQGLVILEGPEAQIIETKKVIVTVSLQVLKSNSIQFIPSLSRAKQDVIDVIQMRNIIKVFMSFKSRCWPEDLFDVVCLDCPIPEFWISIQRNDLDKNYKGQGHHIVTGFIAGEFAENLAHLTNQQIINLFLDQLVMIFGKVTGNKDAVKQNFVQGYVQNWGQNKFIGGGYSCPSLHARVGDREILQAPVDGKLFFAGEATHIHINPCIQAAMETGLRAASQVIANFDIPQSKL